ncbi:MAG: mitochondrial chaperone [Marteilia pararefringens]
MLQIWDENVIFNAGAGLFALGLGTRILSLISRNILLVFRRKIVSSIEVNSLDPSYDWLLKFVRDHSSMNQIGIVTAKMKQDSIMNKPKFISQPEIGTHFFFYNKKLIKAERLRSQNHQFHTGKPFETLKIETMTKDVNFMPNLLHKSYNNFIEEHRSNSRTEIFTPRGIEWMKLGSDKKQRKMNSIFLDANLKKTLIEDFNQFINSQNWYNRCGIPYKRGYLFHGPPGCGKSSTIMAFAGEYNMNIGVINLSEIGLGDERLFYLLSIVPANTLIVMEDIDRILSGIDEKESQSPKFKGLNNLTYSGLLNALDGVASTNGLISFMTTNNYHK